MKKAIRFLTVALSLGLMAYPARAQEESAGANGAGKAETKDQTRVVTTALSAAEQEQKEAALKSDIVLQAMHDELARNMKSLHLPNYPLPYFVSYEVMDSENDSISASFGAIEHADQGKHRRAEISMRLGDKKLDNTMARGGTDFLANLMGAMGGNGGGGTLVLDDNYDALRFNLWSQTDRAYKRAVEALESAKAQLTTLNVEDRPDCFSSAPPAVQVDEIPTHSFDMEEWKKRLQELSAIMKKYPEIKSSRIYINNYVRTKRFVNSEGTVMRLPSVGTTIGIYANAECKDGMNVYDSDFVEAANPAGLPNQDELKAKVEKVCLTVVDLYNAARAEHYVGPVLFEKTAAAEFVVNVIPPLVCAKRTNLSLNEDEDQILNKSVLSKMISVSDDATAKTYNGLPLKGGWTIDYEGVRPVKLDLVENGILKTLCSTRTPNRAISVSNGHYRGRGPCPSHLFLTTKDNQTSAMLKEKLIALGKEQELPFVLIARHSDPSFLNNYGSNMLAMMAGMAGAGHSIGRPTVVYKVDVQTGKEELIRGAHFNALPKRGLKELQLACDDATTYTVNYQADESNEPISLVTPSILVRELEVAKPPRATVVPPYLKDPYFEEKGSQK